MHEVVRQRLSIQFPPSMAVTPCLVSLHQRVADQIPSHFSLYGNATLKPNRHPVLLASDTRS
jgi:hypothetical protein